MGQRLRRFYKVDEDESFVKITAKDCEVVEIIELEPQSDTGCWRQKSTGKRFYRGAIAAVYPDGSSDREDYEWIEC